MIRSVQWDGKDLAAIQMLTATAEHWHGVPAARVDADWNLTVMTTGGLRAVRIGQYVLADEHGCLTVSDVGV